MLINGEVSILTDPTGERRRRVARRLYGLRALGLGLGAVMVATVFAERRVAVPAWVLLALHALVWPQIAYGLLRRDPDPAALEQRMFLGDAAMCGVWIALCQFNLLPGALIVSTTAITLLAIGGGAMLWRGLAVQALACAVAAVANGVAFAPRTDPWEVLASIPLMVAFPMVLGGVTWRLSRRVRAQNAELRRLSSIDGLSGLLNRQRWEDAVDALLGRGCCDDAVMLLVDIDQFKRVNDQRGHTVGDEVIRRIGAVIRASLRDGDLAGRYGGDEFAVVLRGITMPAAVAVAERIRSGVACSLFEHAPGLRCTISVGLAASAASLHATRDWVRVADTELYRAKLAGRNRFAAAH